MKDFRVRVVYNDIPKLSKRAEQVAAEITAKAAHDVEAHAKNVAPVDTGALKNSIAAERVQPLLWHVAPHVKYAIYVEYGTRKMQAQPYMRPAAERVREPFIAAMKRLIEAAR